MWMVPTWQHQAGKMLCAAGLLARHRCACQHHLGAPLASPDQIRLAAGLSFSSLFSLPLLFSAHRTISAVRCTVFRACRLA